MDDPTDAVTAEPSKHRANEQQLLDRLSDFSDPTASEERFREAADDDAYSPHLRAVLSTQLARALGIQRRTDEALAMQRELVVARPDDQYVRAEIEVLTAAEPTIEE